MSSEVITQAVSLRSRQPSTRALLALAVRLANTFRSISTLVRTAHTANALEVAGNDCAALLRCMYDAFLQADYIYRGTMDREHSGRLYLDFEKIERYRMATEVVTQRNAIARHLANSSLRMAGEARNRQAYEENKAPYLTARKNRTRDHWYAGSLRDLARAVGREEEYFWFVKIFDSAVHSGPYAVFNGPPMLIADFVVLASVICSSVMAILVQHANLSVSARSKEVLEIAEMPHLPHELDRRGGP